MINHFSVLQHLPVSVRCIHQSTPIRETLSTDLRGQVPVAGIITHQTTIYIHCNGTSLRLTDPDFGSEQYTTSDYYLWQTDETRNHQLLYIIIMYHSLDCCHWYMVLVNVAMTMNDIMQ